MSELNIRSTYLNGTWRKVSDFVYECYPMHSAGAGEVSGTADEFIATSADEPIAAYYSVTLHIHECTLPHS